MNNHESKEDFQVDASWLLDLIATDWRFNRNLAKDSKMDKQTRAYARWRAKRQALWCSRLRPLMKLGKPI